MSAIATFDPINITTVKNTYSWDEGTPLVELTLADLEVNNPNFILSSLNDAGIEYLGYSPFAAVTLSSVMTPNPSAVATKRIIDFGDYYNSESNIIMTDTVSAENFCHVYIMPGVYTVKMTVVEYIRARDIPLNTALPSNSLSLYVQPTELKEDLPIFWQWYNYYCENKCNPPNLRNKETKWSETQFQETEQFTWAESSSPCVDVAAEDVSWMWDDHSCALSASTFGVPLSWTSVECDSCLNKTWNETLSAGLQTNCIELATTLVAVTTQYVIKDLIRVVEIPPRAFLKVHQDPNINNRISPYRTTLSPIYVRCGSFPIEKIEWDLGDGTPILTQRRWSVNTNPKFKENFEYAIDWKDPRNFDVVHDYTRTPTSGSSFYPSLTCYASSTRTSDCVSGLVGPLKLPTGKEQNLATNKINILQNELTDHGKVLIGEVNDTLAVWRYNK
jgi:hypothetical protein